MSSSKVAISLPPELLRLIDAEAKMKGVTRSEFIRGAVVDFFERARERADSKAYELGYESQPEDEDDVLFALQTATAAIAQEPWS